MTFTEATIVSAASMILGVAGREAIGRVVENFGKSNGGGKASWREAITQSVGTAIRDENAKTVIPALNAQTKVLDELVTINRDISKGIIELCAIQRGHAS